MLKVLISCYACSPYKGSEPGLGWNIVSRLSEFHEVHAIVEKQKWEKDIKQELLNNPNQYKNLKFYFVEKQRGRLLRKIWPPSYYWFYKKWHKDAFNLAKKLEEKEDFDVVHQFNMIGYREPGYLWQINKPFVWGPVGGFAQMKWNFFSCLSSYDRILYFFRNILNEQQMRRNSRVKKVATRADLVVSASIDSYEAFNKYYSKPTVLMNETGATVKNTEILKDFYKKELDIVWAGLIIGRKALPLLLKSLSCVPSDVNYKLHILGEGPGRIQCEKLAKNLNVNAEFYGNVSHKEVQEIFSKSLIFAFSSLQEGTPHVVLESLANGLPVVCHDINGQATVVDSSCGIKIPLVDIESSQSGFCNAITKLSRDRQQLAKLSAGAVLKSREMSWENKANQISSFYELAITNFNNRKAK